VTRENIKNELKECDDIVLGIEKKQLLDVINSMSDEVRG
jgi:hypothetical protein